MILCNLKIEVQEEFCTERESIWTKRIIEIKKINLNKHRLENDMQNSRPKEGYTEQPECKNRKEGLRKL